jgi:hypothetical protein
MSVLIKGMKMPEKCGLCDLFHAESPMHCTVVKGHKTVGAPYGMLRPDWCPLVALPDKHGRFVDADALIEFIDNRYDVTWKDDYEGGIKDAYTDILEKIDTMPTVIEAEDGE